LWVFAEEMLAHVGAGLDDILLQFTVEHLGHALAQEA